jgi:biotin carboxyl carrier protein
MNYNIHIGDTSYFVEIEDINQRPIVARVNGKVFTVNPEIINAQAVQLPATTPPAQGEISKDLTPHSGVINAPLPGTIIEVFVKPGDSVETGQVVLIIEAMKMKNSIRSTQDGIVSAVLVSAGQSVAHKQGLVEFME